MTTTEIMVLGNLLAASAEIEAMKIDNVIRQMNGNPLNYGANDFFEKAEEIRGVVNQLFA